MRTIRRVFLPVWSILQILFIGSCEKNPVDDNGLRLMREVYSGVIIVNEGHFQQGNASISYFDSDSQQVFNNVFKIKNGAALGDVGNSISLRDTLAYVVVNNSDKIEVISTATFKRSQTIRLPAGTSPRHAVFTGENEIMVTSLYTGKVIVVDLQTGAVTGEITVGANPEEVMRVDSKIFVANSGFGGGNTVSVIDLPVKQVRSEIIVGDNPRFLRLDPDGRIQVLCSGAYNDWADPADDTPGGIWVIDPVSETVLDSLVLPAGKHPGKFDLSPGGSGYVIVDDRIWTYDTRSLEILDEDLIAGAAMTPYALGYNIYDNLLYILDAGDYINPGKLWLSDPVGSSLQGPYMTGVIPGDLAFIVRRVSE